MQTSAYYKEVPASKVNQTMCDEFHQKLNEHPEAILKQLKGDKNSPFNQAFKQFSDINKDKMFDELMDGNIPEDEKADYLKRNPEKAEKTDDSAVKEDL